MIRSLEKFLQLQRGDLGRGALLFAYMFFIMGSYVVARLARDTLFLDVYNPDKLPFVDLTIALLVGFVVAAYMYVSRHLTLRNLVSGCLVLFALISLVFWWLAEYRSDLAWPYPVLYIWVGLFGVLAPAQVWTIGNFVLTTREAKRIFSLVAGGSIMGAVTSAKFASWAAPRFGTPRLLLVIATALLVCSVLVVLIWRQRERLTLAENSAESRPVEKVPTVRDSLRQIWSAPYLRVLAMLILVANITTSMAGWQFKALAKYFYPNRDNLAAFFGDFYFYAGLAGWAVQILVTNRLLKRYGLGPALFIVPLALFFGASGVLFWGMATVWAAIGLRSCINVLQYSIDKPSVELLYLPVATDVKNQVKSFIDTVVWRFGDGLAAVLQMSFLAIFGWTWIRASQASWITMTLVLGWLIAAIVARHRYVDVLRESVRQHRLDAERASAPVLDKVTTEILADKLHAADPQEILYALDLFQMGRHRAAHPAVRDLLGHPAPEVRRKAISILAAAQDKVVLSRIESLLHDPDLEVRTEALLFMTHHAHADPLQLIEQIGDFPGFSIRSGMVSFLAQPGPTQNLEAARVMLQAMVSETGSEGQRTRVEAARLVGRLPDAFDAQLQSLLDDTEIDVLREAVRAAGRLRKRSALPRLLSLLTHSDLVPDVVEAVAQFGDHVVGTLRDHLGDPSVPLAARREIPAILVRIGTAAAERVLVENLLEADTTLRARVISSLNKLHQLHPEIETDTMMVETILAAEIMGHYRSYQILGTLGGDLEKDDAVTVALRESMNDEIERIFRLLGLLYPTYDLHSAYFGLQSTNPVVHSNALEFLDNILRPQVRNMLVPVLDSAVPIADRVALANQAVGAAMQTREEAVTALVLSDDPWLKSCGAYAIGMFNLHSLERELDTCLSHPDPLLRETARQAKLRLAAQPT